MKPRRAHDVEQLFHELSELQGRERQLVLAQRCGDDRELRRELESLLAAHDAMSPLDEVLQLGSLRAGVVGDVHARQLETGESIGPYRVVTPLGRGGMGSVYLVSQTIPVQRRLALKLIDSEIITSESLRRFNTECELLARLNSPHIASLLDSGVTDDGRPYFTMEYVDGRPITKYCDEHELSIAERIELFLQLCDGIRHAHLRGVLHRDIKPSNVLVTEIDGRARVKIIDFGIGRLVEGPQALRPSLRAAGPIGTLEYMSPEQVRANPEGVDLRSDVYSAGVVLFELLVGELPHSRDEIDREGAEALTTARSPSSRISEILEGSQERARQRRVDVGRLRGQLRGELDWICLRALEAEPEKRYPTIDSFAEDIRRAQRNEAVEAGPKTAIYGFRKWVRRHRLMAGTIGVVVGSLLSATLISSSFYLKEQRAHAVADRAQAESKAMVDFVSRAFSELLSDSKLIRPEDARAVLDSAFGQLELVAELGTVPRAALRVYLSEVCNELGFKELARDQWELAQSEFQQAGATSEFEYALALLGCAHQELGDRQAAEAARPYLEMAREVVLRGRMEPYDEAILRAKLGYELSQLGEQDEAMAMLEVLHAGLDFDPQREKLFQVGSSSRIRGLVRLLKIYSMKGRGLDAQGVLASIERLSAQEEIEDSATLFQLADSRAAVLAAGGEPIEAATAFAEVGRLCTTLYGAQSPFAYYYRARSGYFLALAGQVDEGARLLDEDITRCAADAQCAESTVFMHQLYRGDCDRLRSELDAAATRYESAARILRAHYPNGSQHREGRLAYRRGVLALARGQLETARAELESAQLALATALGVDSTETLDCSEQLAELALREGRPELARELLEQVRRTRSSLLGDASPHTVRVGRKLDMVHEQWRGSTAMEGRSQNPGSTAGPHTSQPTEES